MSKTIQEIMEVMGKTVEASMTLERRSGSSYFPISDIKPEDINELRYYFDGALYCSVMRCLEVKLKGNWTDKVKKDLLLDNLNIKVTHPEGDYASIGYGCFIVSEEPEYDAAQNLTSIIAYDELYPSMRTYEMSLDWSSGISLKNYLIAILNKLNISYNESSLSLMANADKTVTSEKFIDIENDSTESAYTYRDVLDEIAKASGVTFAFKNSLGGNPFKLYAIKPTESGYILDESNLRSVTIGAKYGPVKGVVLSREPQDDNVFYPKNLTDSDTAVKIANVEIIEDSDSDTYRENFIQGIYNNVKNIEYYLYDLDSFGIGFLNFGDIFTIKACNRENGEIGEEKPYKTIFMRTDMTVGDGIKEKSKLEAPQATSTDYSAASTTDKTLKKTMLKVDKQNQKITALAKETDEKYAELWLTTEGLNADINDAENGLKATMIATAEKADTAYEKAIAVENAGYITTENAKTLISQSAEDITLSVEKSLKIGARNILLDSACFGSFTPTGNSNVSGIITQVYTDTNVPSGKHKTVSWTAISDGTAGFSFDNTDIIGQNSGDIDKIKPNTTYTLSFWIKQRYKKITLNPDLLIYTGATAVSYDAERQIIPETKIGEWQKFVVSFTTGVSVNNFRLRLYFSDCTNSSAYITDISSFKLEEGNIVTDWSPSSEDVEQSVKAQIDLCVKTDENGKLVSAIAIEGNKISIKSDKFTLESDGSVLCSDLTCARVDEETGEESGFSMNISQAEINHTFAGDKIGKLGTSLDSFGLYYETLSGASDCGVALISNDGAGYNLRIHNGGAELIKSGDLTSLVLTEEQFAVTKGADYSLHLAKVDDYNISHPYYTRPRMAVISSTDLLLAANESDNKNGDVYISGKHIILDGEVIFNEYRQSGEGTAPLRIYKTSGEAAI